MTTVPVPPVMPGPAARPLLALDTEELRLSSPRGDAVTGVLTLSNRGDALLEGAISVRVGGEWLRVEPAALRLAPGESRRVEVRADPAGLAPGYTPGEIAAVTNGGGVTIGVRLGVRTGRSWRGLALAGAASVLVVAIIGVLLAKVEFPANAPPTPPPVVAPSPHHHGVPSHPAHQSAPSFDMRAALAGLRGAIYTSNALWQAALTHPSTAYLSSVKTGSDLARVSAEVQDLLANGEHWQIDQRTFVFQGLHVAADGASGWGAVEKTERRVLYGPGPTRAPLTSSDAVYHLRYSVMRQGGRWLVDDVRVTGLTPRAGTVTGAAPLTVQQVFDRVLPTVMHVEADSSGQTAVGTGIVIGSGAGASYIITNDHVVSGANTVKLQRWVHNGYYPPSSWIASKWWEDSADDLAVIRIDQGNLPAATWGDSEALQPAAAVVAIGYAENLSGGPTVTNGIVSSLRRTAPDSPNGPFYIGHSATINHGNSGGPLADMSGHIVGINTWTLDNTQGLFFAIPANRAAGAAANFIGSNG